MSSKKLPRAALLMVAFASVLLAPAFVAAGADDLDDQPSPLADVVSWIPPKPGVSIDPAELAAHTSSFQGGRVSLGRQPMAAPPDWSHGDHTGVIILAAFSDINPSSLGKAYYDDKANYNGTSRASVRTFWYENSMGNYTVNWTVTDWVTLPNTQAYYDANTNRLVGDAAVAANSQVDFSKHDDDGDGYVDSVMVVHSGGDQAAGCSPNCIWSHMSYGNRRTVDGVYVSAYATVADFGYANGGDSLGVLVHEFGHLGLGLPDLYDQTYQNDGLSLWDMMAGGSWSMNHLSAWCKEYLGWVDPFVPTFNLNPYKIYPAGDARYNPLKLTTNYTNEYFLIEMRDDQNPGMYDYGVPANGIVIYHIDSNTVQQGWSYGFETNTAHKAIDIEENGAQDLDTQGGGGFANDVWVANFNGFSPTSTPNSNLYINGGAYATGIKIFNISSIQTTGGRHMTFNVETGRIDYGLSAQVLGSPEKSADPGSSAVYPIQFRTASSQGDNVSLQIQGASQTLGSIDRTLLVLPPFGSATVNLTVTVPLDASAGDPAWVQVFGQSQTVTVASFLVPTITRASQLYGVEALQASELDFWAVPDQMYQRSFTVRNLGNGIDNVSVSVVADPALLSASVVTQWFLLPRGGSTAVPIDFQVAHNVPYQTAIPVTIDLQYGALGSLQHLRFDATVRADKLSLLAVSVQALGTYNLYPEQGKMFNITIENLGNYDAAFDLSTSTPAGITAAFDLGSISVTSFSPGVMAATVTVARNTEAGTSGLVWFKAKFQDVDVWAEANLSFVVLQRFELGISGDSFFAAPPGSNALFNLVAINQGNGPDQVSLSFSPSFAEWNASLSLDSLPLDTSNSGRTAAFELRATIPADAPGNFEQLFVVLLRSANSGTYASLEIRIHVLPVYAFEATADAAQGPITGGESASFLLSFRNRGNVRDSYSVTLDGLPEGWTTEFAEGGIATVMPKGTGQATLIVRPAAGAASDRYDFQIFVASEGNLSRPAVIQLNVTIVAYREIDIRVTPVDGEVRPGATVTLQVVVKNLGNVRENVFFLPTGSFESVVVDPLQVSVPAFEERVVTVIVVMKADQPAGINPLAIQVTDVNHPEVTAETSVDINVAAVQVGPSSTPGLEAVAAVAALAGVAAVSLMARRRRD